MIHTACDNDIAIVGMACSFSGARDLTECWRNLIHGVDIFTPAPNHEADRPDPHTPPHKSDFNSVPSLLRDIAEHALDDAGIAASHYKIRHRTQLILGLDTCFDGARTQTRQNALALRLSEELELGETPLSVNGDEAATLRALRMGIQRLREGRCDVALFAVGCPRNDVDGENNIKRLNTDMQPLNQASFHSLESAAAVVLKRTGDAEIAGDRAYAVIKGIATIPEDDLHAVYSEANITQKDIGYLETAVGGLLHGNIDELNTVKAIFGSRAENQSLRPMGVIACDFKGTEGKLGLAALIKAALCLSNKIIPPIVFTQASPTVPDELPFYLNLEPRPWIQDVLTSNRHAAINSLHRDGRLTHIILEEIGNGAQRGKILPKPIKNDFPWDSEVVVLGAEDAAELTRRVGGLLAFLQREHPGVSLADVAYTQCTRFDSDAGCRLAVVSTDLEDLRQQLATCHSRLQTPSPSFEDLKSVYFSETGNRRHGKIAFLFPGQGFPGLLGPYADHLLDLCLRFPEVRAAFDAADARDGHPEDPIPTSQLFFPPAAFSEKERQRLRKRLASPRLADGDRMKIVAERDLSSFGVMVANWGSWNLLQKLGVPVDMYFGQSHGELSALCAAGAMEIADVLPLHWEVQYDPEEFITSNGRLAVVCTSEECLSPLLNRFRNVNIAVHVSPDFQILGGESEQLNDIINEIRNSGIWTQLLPYPAIHTPYFSSLRPELEFFLNKVPVHPFAVPVYSGMICDVYPGVSDRVRQIMIANLDYPVLLWQTIQKMYRDGARIFIQVGGGATMYAQAKNIIGSNDVVTASVDVDYRSAISQLNHLCATLLTNGISLDLEHLYEYRSLRHLNMDVTEAQTNASSVDCADHDIGFAGSDLSREDRRSQRLSQDGAGSLDEPRMPFIDKILHFIPNREIVVERTMDFKEDLYLQDHLFIVAEGIKPASARFPVLPMTVGMEMLAEVAACLAPGYGLLGFENLRAGRWIELVHTDALVLRTSAQLRHYDEVADTYRIDVGLLIEGNEKPAIQATVLVGKRYEVTLHFDFSLPQNPRRHPLRPEQIYEEHFMFHGPIFQSLSGDTVLAERSVMGELTVLPKNNMFHSIRRPEFLTDPNLLDGVGQLIGLWGIEENVYVFPIGIHNLEIYCPTPEMGTRVAVRIEITHFNSKFLKADVEVQNGAGGVWMRIQGWEDWIFRWPKKAYQFRRHPTRYLTSHRLTLAGLPLGAMAQQIKKTDMRDLPRHHMAGFYLHMDEMPTFWALQQSPNRQFQWLMGRIAAKDAIRRWLVCDKNDEMLHPAAFKIENDENRVPVIKNIPKPLKTPRLSISHSTDRAVALVHSDAVAIDAEQIVHRDEVFLKTIAGQAEIDLCGEFLKDETDAWITRLWCAKEAAAKLAGTGFKGSPRRFEAVDAATDGAIIIFDHHRGGSILVHTRQEDGFILAYAARMPE